jgi:hypothetical protein
MTEKHGTSEPRPRRTATEIEQLVAEYGRSGVTQKEFCLSRGLALSTLQRYLHNGLRKQKAPAKNRLVAVEVASGGGLREPAAGCGLALVWGEGCKLEVHRGFDEATLQRLLDVLERR